MPTAIAAQNQREVGDESMNTTFEHSIKVSPHEELIQHLPRYLQLMLEIEEMAQAEFDGIMQDIREGKTSLENIKKERGII